MHPTTAYQLATARMAELHAEARSHRLATETAQDHQSDQADGGRINFTISIRLWPIRFRQAIRLSAPRSDAADCL